MTRKRRTLHPLEYLFGGLYLLIKKLSWGPWSSAADVLLAGWILVSCVRGAQAIRRDLRVGRSRWAAAGKGLVLVGMGAFALLFLVLPKIGGDTWLTRPPRDFPRAEAREHLVPFEQLDAPGEQVLQAVSLATHGRRLVGLGESHHLTAEYSQAKVALIRHLHEHEGFDVLLFENPVAQLWLAMKEMATSGYPQSGIMGLFGIWKTHEVLPLFEYVLETQKTSRPLRVIGIDPQHFFETWDAAQACLLPVLEKIDPALAREEISNRDRWASILEKGEKCEPDDPRVTAGRAHYARLAERLRSAADAAAEDPTEDALELLVAVMIAEGFAVDLQVQTLDYPERYYVRDRAMARNIIRLVEGPFAGERVMFWAHNTHLCRSPDLQQPLGFDFYRTGSWWLAGRYPWEVNTGALLARHFGQAYYCIGFLARSGHMGYMHRFDGWDRLRARRRDAVESLLAPDGDPAVFLDVAAAGSLFEGVPLYFYRSGYRLQKAEIQEQFDGLVIIDKVTPSSRTSWGRASRRASS